MKIVWCIKRNVDCVWNVEKDYKCNKASNFYLLFLLYYTSLSKDVFGAIHKKKNLMNGDFKPSHMSTTNNYYN